MVYEHFIDQGWIEFGPTDAIITRYFEARDIPRRSIDEATVAAVTDLIHLNAAEAAVFQSQIRLDRLQEREVPRELPIRVAESTVEFAVWSSDSGPFFGHDPRADLRLWDVALFGSDASKLAWILGSDSVHQLAEQFIPVVSELAAMYRDALPAIYGQLSDSPAVVPLVAAYESQGFALRATLWRAKIAVLTGEDDFEQSVDAVFAALRPSV